MTNFKGSEGFLNRLANTSRLRFVSDMGLPIQGIGRRTRHYDFENTLGVVVIIPSGTQRNDGFVEVNANAAAHAHNHGFAVQGFRTLLEMFHNIIGDKPKTFFRTNHSLKSRPFGFEFFLAGFFLVFGYFLELHIKTRFFALV